MYIIPHLRNIDLHILNIWSLSILLIIFLNEPEIILLHKVKWFQVLLYISKNSLNISHLFTHKQMIKQFFFKQFNLALVICTQFKRQTVRIDLYIGHNQVLPLRAKVDLGAMAMEGYSAFPTAPALLKPYPQIVKCHMQDTFKEPLPLYRDAVGKFYNPSRLV